MTYNMLAIIAIGIFLAIVAIISRCANPKSSTRKALPQGTVVHYTKHAKERMVERGVSAAQLELVLAAPQRTVRDPENDSVRLERDFDGDALKVWVAEPWPARGEIVIKTTAWKRTVGKHILEFEIPSEAICHVVGREGRTIRSIQARTGTHVSIRHGATVQINADDRVSAERAREEVNSIVEWLVGRAA